MAVKYQAVGTNTTAISAQISVPWPTHQIGDLGILVVVSATASGISVPSGWTEIARDNGLGWSFGVFYKWATSAAMGNATSVGAASVRNNGYIFTLRGANDQSAPIGASAMYSVAATTSGWQTSAGSISANGKSCLVCVVGTSGSLTANNAVNGWNKGGFSLSGTLTERNDYTTGGYGLAVGVAELVGGDGTVAASVYLSDASDDLYEYEFIVKHGSEGNFFALL